MKGKAHCRYWSTGNYPCNQAPLLILEATGLSLQMILQEYPVLYLKLHWIKKLEGLKKAKLHLNFQVKQDSIYLISSNLSCGIHFRIYYKCAINTGYKCAINTGIFLSAMIPSAK